MTLLTCLSLTLIVNNRPLFKGVDMHFGSDNQTGASSQIMNMILQANNGYTHGYGEDAWTARAVQALSETFDCDLAAYFVATGTAANSLALACLVQPWETVLCHHQAHILIDESTAPEFYSGGARLIPISHGAGKLTVEQIDRFFHLAGRDYPHNARPGALSFAQSSELGQVYTPQEITALCTAAHAEGMAVHMDGARFANAVAALGCSPAELTWKAGVDVLSLGTTKNGALMAEAVIFFNKDLAAAFAERRKRGGHLVSKGRFFGVQFIAWLENGHWLELARHANQQAARLAEGLVATPGIRLTWPVQANEIFVILPQTTASRLQAAGATFYEWYLEGLPPHLALGQEESFIRLVTSFITRDEDITEFLKLLT
jgi:threonine aldolase